MKSSQVTLLAILFGLLLTMPTAAQDPTTRARSRQLLEQGYAADQAGDPERAVELYQESFEIYPSYDVAGNLGVLEAKLGRFPEAANHLSYCLRHFPTGESAKLRALIEKNLQTAQEHVGSVRIKVDRLGAQVTIGNEEVGQTPLDYEVYLAPGQYGVRAEAGEEAAESTLEVQQGELTNATLTLAQRVPARMPASGLTSEEETKRRGIPSLAPGYVLGGLTVAAVATSVVFRAMAGKKRNQVEDLLPDAESGCTMNDSSACDKLKKFVRQHDDFGRVSHVTLIVGVVGAAATIGYATYALVRRKRASAVTPGVAFDGRSGVLFLNGSF